MELASLGSHLRRRPLPGTCGYQTDFSAHNAPPASRGTIHGVLRPSEFARLDRMALPGNVNLPIGVAFSRKSSSLSPSILRTSPYPEFPFSPGGRPIRV